MKVLGKKCLLKFCYHNNIITFVFQIILENAIFSLVFFFIKKRYQVKVFTDNLITIDWKPRFYQV